MLHGLRDASMRLKEEFSCFITYLIFLWKEFLDFPLRRANFCFYFLASVDLYIWRLIQFMGCFWRNLFLVYSLICSVKCFRQITREFFTLLVANDFIKILDGFFRNGISTFSLNKPSNDGISMWTHQTNLSLDYYMFDMMCLVMVLI